MTSYKEQIKKKKNIQQWQIDHHLTLNIGQTTIQLKILITSNYISRELILFPLSKIFYLPYIYA